MKHSKNFPMALDPPKGSTVPITRELVERAVEMSRLSPRKRIIQPLHQSPDDTLHRMLNAMQPGTYIRPHRHSTPPKAESVIVVSGALRLVTFSDDGQIANHFEAGAGGVTFGFDAAPDCFHTVIVLKPDTVMFETKPGPYTQIADKDFADWAPAENTLEAVEYLAELTRLTSI